MSIPLKAAPLSERVAVCSWSLQPADAGPSAPSPGLGPLSPTEDKPTGIKVHLSGKLSDY